MKPRLRNWGCGMTKSKCDHIIGIVCDRDIGRYLLVDSEKTGERLEVFFEYCPKCGEKLNE